ncbi:MAG: hypothetical protein GEU97_17350 [Actinophytocola sp.]|nr:hypothetical protein [Actinophytocola sp.]
MKNIARKVWNGMRGRPAAAVLGGALVLLLSGGTAVAAGHIGTDDIRDYSITKQKMKRDSVGSWEAKDRSLTGGDLRLESVGQRVFTPRVRELLNQTGIKNLESDGPYPGVTQLEEGSNSTDKWAADGTFQSSWVKCAEGKTAIGGGFSRADEGPEAYKGLNIVTSQPVQIENGDPTAYNPIEGDADGSYVPNGWLVEGFNDGTTELIVRPHVVCAELPQG